MSFDPAEHHCRLLRETRAPNPPPAGYPAAISMRLLGTENSSTTAAFYAFAALDMMR
jgi:integrase/recombinase XerD